MADCSLASASTVTRPCCWRTLLKCLVRSNVYLLKSPFIGVVVSLVGCCEGKRRSGHENDTGVHAGGGVFVEARAQVGFPLRLKKVVERAHFRFIISAPCDLPGASER